MMETENKEEKEKSHGIWGWILVIFGGLFTLSGLCLLVVFVSSPNSDVSSYLFSALLLMIGALLLFISIRMITRKDKKISKFISIGGAIAVLVLAAIFCVSVVSSGKPKESSTQKIVESTTSILQATFTPLPTYTSYPTYTFIPPSTNTPGPTNTPLPTASPTATFTITPTSTRTPKPTTTLPPTRTPIPSVSLDDIYDNFKNMTEYQFSVYKSEIAGKPVREIVTVGNVDEHGRLNLTGPWSPWLINWSDFCVAVTGTPSDILISLNGGDDVHLEATINGIVGNNNYYINCENTLVLVYVNITK
jgi:flagellar basal body-associated protein FliL